MCDIESYLVPTTDAADNLYALGPSRAQSRCKTHGWMFQPHEALGPERLCPIGRIEAAKEQALAEIRAAAGSDRDER